MNICTYSVGEEEEEASCSLPGFYCPLCGLLLRPTHDAWTQMGTIKLAANRLPLFSAILRQKVFKMSRQT